MDAHHPFYSLALAMRRACSAPDGELAIAKLVSQIVEPSLTEHDLDQLLDDLFAELVPINTVQADAVQADAVQVDSVQALMQWLKGQRFGLSDIGQASPNHSNLAWVLTHRCGIPISVGVLLIEIARKAGFTAQGINYPGHFLVRVEEYLIDPLSMEVVDDDKLDQDINWLVANSEAIALRMINNLKAHAFTKSDFQLVLNLLDLQLYITDSRSARATLYYEQAEVWLKFGSVSVALEALARCIACSDHEELTLRAQARMDAMQGDKEIRH